MNATRRLGVAGFLCAALALPLAVPSSASSPPPQDPAAISAAIAIGRSSPPELDRFHAGYRVPIDDPVIRGLEIVTGFRRVVQLTEEHARLRDATWGAARAAQESRNFEGRLDVAVRLQFSPANTYRTVPPYSVVIYRRGEASPLLPVDVRSVPSYVSAQPAPPGTPILAATVTATFDAGQLETSAPILVGIFLDGREVRRVAADLGAMR